MKRFWKDAAVLEVAGGWNVALDGRPVKTQGGLPQIAPTRALADAMAAEWDAQGDDIAPRSFPLRDLTDFAIDRVATGADDTVSKALAFAQTDTLCYRSDPGTALSRRQDVQWEPILSAFEQREAVAMQRVASIVHVEQSPATISALRGRLEALDPFTLAGIFTLASLSASLSIAMTVLVRGETGETAETLWNAANLEADIQAELWGQDAEALVAREEKTAAFLKAAEFLDLLAG